jgi:hypothetical protein
MAQIAAQRASNVHRLIKAATIGIERNDGNRITQQQSMNLHAAAQAEQPGEKVDVGNAINNICIRVRNAAGMTNRQE